MEDTETGDNLRVSSQRLIERLGTRNSRELPPHMEGMLEKYSPSLFVNWQRRFVTLDQAILRYYEQNNGQNKHRGTINFDLYFCEVIKSSKKGQAHHFSIKFHSNDREFQLRAASEAEADQWISAINAHIEISKGLRDQIPAPITNEFWRQEQISEEQFFELADTFDLLLFKTNHSTAGLVRAFTKSEWDHAAMVLEFGSEPGQVFILEATHDLGVCIRNFSDIIPVIGDHYTKVALRHIEWERTNASLGILEKFLEEV